MTLPSLREQRDAHLQSLMDLELGHPLRCLRQWRTALMAERPRVESHLQAAEAALACDVMAPLRRRVLQLLNSLLSGEPGQHEASLLGEVLLGWGDRFVAEAPVRALQAYERAWSCGSQAALAPRLAELYARQGMAEGAGVLLQDPASLDPASLDPWPKLPCNPAICAPCQQRLGFTSRELPPAGPLASATQSWPVHGFPQGAIWVHSYLDPSRHTGAVAVLTADGEIQPHLSRLYPHPWATCRRRRAFESHLCSQLQARTHDPRHPRLQRLKGAVLAVADLSAETYFHWQLETLPRLGRAWRQLHPQLPDLRLWHNGGSAPWVAEGLARLGLAPHQVLSADRYPAIQADWLFVPEFAPFGQPPPANLQWLEHFWLESVASPAEHLGMQSLRPGEPGTKVESPQLWLPRGLTARRPVIHAPRWPELQLQMASVQAQLQQIASAKTILAPHGAAMANLLAARPGSLVVELVNPSYNPPYYLSLLHYRSCRHLLLPAARTPFPLAEVLYESPLTYPIDLTPGSSPAAEWISHAVCHGDRELL